MSKDAVERISIRTELPSENLVEKFSSLLPGVIQDGVLDVVRLGELLGVPTAGLPNTKERFGLMWAGKKKAVEALQAPSMASLAPDLENSLDWETATNVFIEGDNLEVLKLLQKSYNDKVKMIYIDPPYNTGKDFVYKDDFSDLMKRYLEVTGQISEEGNRLQANIESSGRLHSSWLSFMFPRLNLARNLLKEDGLIFISIDKHEVDNLRLLMDEIFGSENFLSTLIWNQGHSQQQGVFKEYHEYVMCYGRNSQLIKTFADPDGGEVVGGALKKISKANPSSSFEFPAGIKCEAADGTEFTGTWGESETTTLVSGRFQVMGGITQHKMTLAAGWTQKNQMKEFYYGDGEVFDTRNQKVLEFFFNNSGKLKYRKERTAFTPPTIQNWGTQSSASKFLVEFLEGDFFDRPKPMQLIKDLIAWTTSDEDIILDFFGGSGTTGHAVLDQNASDNSQRRFIVVNLPEETGKESNARKTGFKSVSDITRFRLKKAANSDEKNSGLRCFTLSPSSFLMAGELVEGGLPLLSESTLRKDASDEEIASEALLKQGIALDEPWLKKKYEKETVIQAGRVAVVLARKLSHEVVEAALADDSTSTVVFLEDGFAGRDEVKANAHFAFKQKNKTMKTV